MESPEKKTQVEIFERIGEYKAILDNLAEMSQRRQVTNNVYVGLNTIFLTALGVFISTHLNLTMWSTAIEIGVISIAILPLNIIWLFTITRYAQTARLHYDYLREIEEEFRDRRRRSAASDTADDEHPIGLFLRIKSIGWHSGHGNTELERLLATYLLCFYPLISLILLALTALVQSHVIPTLSLP